MPFVFRTLQLSLPPRIFIQFDELRFEIPYNYKCIELLIVFKCISLNDVGSCVSIMQEIKYITDVKEQRGDGLTPGIPSNSELLVQWLKNKTGRKAKKD